MAGKAWTSAEDKRLREYVEQGLHPEDISIKMERSKSAVQQRLGNLGMSYRHNRPERIEEERVEQGIKDELAKSRRLCKELQQALNWQDQILDLGNKSIKALPKIKQPVFKKTKGQTEEEALLLLSDIHYGEVVSHDEMGGLNEYNCDVSNRRLKALTETVQDLIGNKMVGYNFQKLNIFGMGDMVSGTIHAELLENADGNIVSWVTDLAYIIAQMVRELLMVVPKIEFTGVIGNHGRLHKKPRFKEKYVNWDYVCYQFLAATLANEIKAGRVVMDIPRSFWRVKTIQGNNFLILHGDNIQMWNGIPWYGITRATHKLTEMLATQQTYYDYICLGHFHNQGTLDRMKGEMVLNGSVIGANEFSVGKMYTTSQARQLFCGVHKSHGMTWRFPIDLQDRPIAGDPYETARLESRSMGEL